MLFYFAHLISMTHAYDLGFLKWQILIFAISLESGFICWRLLIFFSHREVILTSPALMYLHFNPLLGLLIHWERFDWSLMSSFSLFVSAGLNTYLISGRKFELHSCCGFSQLASAGHELAEQCVASRAHTPDGTSSVCSLPLDSVKVKVHSSP